MKDIMKLGIENLTLDLDDDGVLMAMLNRPGEAQCAECADH